LEENYGGQIPAVPSNTLLESESEMRRWLLKHGKKQFIDFTNQEITQLHKYFQELDEDGSGISLSFNLCLGSIGVEELEKPLISLGLCNNREEVQKIIEEVDEDGSGQIEFNEFLHIIKSASQKKKTRDQK